MSDEAYPSAARAEDEASGWAVGFILFAAIMMIMVGCFQFFVIWALAAHGRELRDAEV